MKKKIISSEMAGEIEKKQPPREELASWPSEPYVLDRTLINWN